MHHHTRLSIVFSSRPHIAFLRFCGWSFSDHFFELILHSRCPLSCRQVVWLVTRLSLVYSPACSTLGMVQLVMTKVCVTGGAGSLLYHVIPASSPVFRRRLHRWSPSHRNIWLLRPYDLRGLIPTDAWSQYSCNECAECWTLRWCSCNRTRYRTRPCRCVRLMEGICSPTGCWIQYSWRAFAASFAFHGVSVHLRPGDRPRYTLRQPFHLLGCETHTTPGYTCAQDWCTEWREDLLHQA